MSVSDNDLEMLETWLDGELPAEESLALTARLGREAELAEALGQLRAERGLRRGVWASLEGDAAAVEELMGKMRGTVERRRMWQRQVRWMSAVSGAAACLVVGLLIGRFLLAPGAGPVSPANPVNPVANVGAGTQQGSGGGEQQGKIEFVGNVVSGPFEVQLADPSGRIIGVQRFSSLEEARQFTEDVNRMQQRPGPISPYRDGRIVPASAEQF